MALGGSIHVVISDDRSRGLIFDTRWLDREFVDRLGLMRGPGESYRDVILRLAQLE